MIFLINLYKFLVIFFIFNLYFEISRKRHLSLISVKKVINLLFWTIIYLMIINPLPPGDLIWDHLKNRLFYGYPVYICIYNILTIFIRCISFLSTLYFFKIWFKMIYIHVWICGKCSVETSKHLSAYIILINST